LPEYAPGVRRTALVATLVAVLGGASASAHTVPRQNPRVAHARQLNAVWTAAVLRLARSGQPVYCGGGRLPEVALTFDDGPSWRTTSAIVALLRSAGASATFFDVGRQATYYPELVRRQRLFGALGDHTWSHARLTGMPWRRLVFQLRWGRGAVQHATRRYVRLFRPPYGERSRLVDRAAHGLHMLQVLWSVDSRDSDGATLAQIERNVLQGLRPGAIVLLHENHPETLVALRRTILPALKRRGLRAVSVPELLATDPPRRPWLGQRACPWPGPEYP
jgi:peptidoglycan/xylan/chitin deacetylase (PgdA/CDA1 family)